MKEIKKDKDVTWLVNVLLLCVFAFVFFGTTFGGCIGRKVQDTDAEYWRQKYLQSQEELMLWRDICHMYYQFKDYEDLDENWEPVRRYTFWEDAIMDTQTFDKLDSIQGGDWEDFYFDW